MAKGKKKNEVAPVDTGTSLMTVDFLDDLERVEYFPQIRMTWGSSPIMNEPDRGGQIGTFYLYTLDKNMGKEFKCTPVDVRPHALWLSNHALKAESFDSTEDIFRVIKGMKNNYPEVQVDWGGDVLLWLPDYDTFAVYFLKGSARRPGIQQFFNFSRPDTRRNLLVRAEHIETKRGAHLHLPVLVETDESFVPPKEEDWAHALQNFQSAKGRLEEKEAVAGDSSKDR